MPKEERPATELAFFISDPERRLTPIQPRGARPSPAGALSGHLHRSRALITLEQYFGKKTHTEVQRWAAEDLLRRNEALRQEYYADTGEGPDIDPDTGTEISGTHGGNGDGGFRAPDSGTGAPHSSHREARGVDNSDQKNKFDAWLDRFEDGKGGNSMLEKHGLYREHPSATNTWCHTTTRAPHSGHRTFNP